MIRMITKDNIDYLRRRTLTQATTPDDKTPSVMVFVVEDSRTPTGDSRLSEHDVLQASALSMVELLTDPTSQLSVEKWLEGRIRKIAKRARNKAWECTAKTTLHYYESTYGTATVRSFEPTVVTDQPTELHKLQMAGLTVHTDITPSVPPASHLAVQVNATLNMSTGKLVAQVNHAVQMFLMFGDMDKVLEWSHYGCLIHVTKENKLNEELSEFQVHDAGLTEVPENSLTCTASYMPSA